MEGSINNLLSGYVRYARTNQHEAIRISLVAMTAPCQRFSAQLGADPGSIPGFGELHYLFFWQFFLRIPKLTLPEQFVACFLFLSLGVQWSCPQLAMVQQRHGDVGL